MWNLLAKGLRVEAHVKEWMILNSVMDKRALEFWGKYKTFLLEL